MAVGKERLFYHEWRRPGEREAGAQKPELLKGVSVTESVGQNRKALWVRGSGPCWELIGRRGGEGNE